jgi:hypothetical protein
MEKPRVIALKSYFVEGYQVMRRVISIEGEALQKTLRLNQWCRNSKRLCSRKTPTWRWVDTSCLEARVHRGMKDDATNQKWGRGGQTFHASAIAYRSQLWFAD